MSASREVWRIILLSKALVALVAIAALYAHFNLTAFRDSYGSWPPGGTPTLSSRFATWDSGHYLRLSQYGYTAGSPSCAFYPLWPASIRAAAGLTGGRPVLAAMLLANALSILGLWLLYRLLERHCNPEAGRDALILMLAFPGALFLSFPYSEALFLALVMLFFWGLELERWSWVAVAGFLLPLARPTGVFVLLPLGWYLYERRRPMWVDRTTRALAEGVGVWCKGQTKRFNWAALSVDRSPVTSLERSDWLGTPTCRPPRMAFSAGAPAGGDPTEYDVATGAQKQPVWKQLAPWSLALCPLLGYAAYFGLLYAWTGNAFEGFAAQRDYPNSPSIANIFNISGFGKSLVGLYSLDGMTDSAVDRLCFLLFLAMLWPIYRLNKVWFFYVLPAGLVPALSSWFMSYRRYFVVLFSMFVVLALLLRKAKSRWLFWYYVVILAALQAWAVKQFVNFNWAG